MIYLIDKLKVKTLIVVNRSEIESCRNNITRILGVNNGLNIDIVSIPNKVNYGEYELAIFEHLNTFTTQKRQFELSKSIRELESVKFIVIKYDY